MEKWCETIREKVLEKIDVVKNLPKEFVNPNIQEIRASSKIAPKIPKTNKIFSLLLSNFLNTISINDITESINAVLLPEYRIPKI